ncbi:hypothetical protein [Agrobacterium pusense]|uniref:hypothetical protein n=1 Tax=Agrobacterium pusense TaxID=648995 RepID=UPI0026971B80
MSDKLYYSKGNEVWKSPIRTKVGSTTNVTLGFQVCTVSDVIGAVGATAVAELLNLGEEYQNGHSPDEKDVHPDDIAVDRFATAMKAKLAKKRGEGRGGWEDKDDCSQLFLTSLLREHVEKGDPVDVGNLAMMLHQRGESILSILITLQGE